MKLAMRRITRVDLVDKGASYDPVTGEGAHVLIHKRADAPAPAAPPPNVAKKIVRRGDEYCVTTADGSKTLGCHPTMQEAQAQLAAVDSAQSKRAPWWTTVGRVLGILKQAYPDGAPSAQTFEEALLARTLDDCMEDCGAAFGALWTAIASSLGDPAVVDKAAAVSAATASFSATLDACVADWLAGPTESDDGTTALAMSADGIRKVGRKIAGERLARMKAAHKVLGVVIREAEGGAMTSKGAAPVDVTKLDEPVRKHIEGLEAQVTELTTKLAAATPPDPWAGISPDVRKRMEDQDAEIKKLRDDNARGVYIAKAAGFKHLPIKADDDWTVLRAIDALDPAVAKRVWELLRAGDEGTRQAAITKGLGGDAQVPSGDAYAQLETLAHAKVAKAAGGLTFAKAFDEVLTTPEGKRLYQEYLAQNPKQSGG